MNSGPLYHISLEDLVHWTSSQCPDVIARYFPKHRLCPWNIFPENFHMSLWWSTSIPRWRSNVQYVNRRWYGFNRNGYQTLIFYTVYERWVEITLSLSRACGDSDGTDQSQCYLVIMYLSISFNCSTHILIFWYRYMYLELIYLTTRQTANIWHLSFPEWFLVWNIIANDHCRCGLWLNFVTWNGKVTASERINAAQQGGIR